MQSLALECYATESLSFQDLLEIDGGHQVQSTAYQIGYAIGEGIDAVGIAAAAAVSVAAAWALFG